MDCHATTPLDPRVIEAMMPAFQSDFGNAWSRHHVYGWRANAAVDIARQQLAHLIGCTPAEIVFTSGATESNNLALKGSLAAYSDRGNHIVTVGTEHKSVLDVCKSLERRGTQVTYLPVARDGRVDLNQLADALTDQTVVCSVMVANNEIGTLQPILEIGQLCRQRGILFHSDAVQGVGKIPLDVNQAQVDLLSVSAHKLYGPKGVGALFVRKKPRVRLEGLIEGGGQERGLRSGTLNVPGIVGLGKAAELCEAGMTGEALRIGGLRDRLWMQISTTLPGVTQNGSLDHRLPGNLNVSFSFIDAEALMLALRGVAVSSSSACTSASVEGSYVLKACGVSEHLARGSIRFGLGRFNTAEEVDQVAAEVIDKVQHLRQTNRLFQEASR